jgi:NADH:ubiquinone oxidoreductase subunit D
MLRGSGVSIDLRKTKPYECYAQFQFDIPVGQNGDSYDRYKIRIAEMRQSLKIIGQALNKLPGGRIRVDNNKIIMQKRESMKSGMENIIHHFKNFSNYPDIQTRTAYIGIEAPKGEFGIFVSMSSLEKFQRCKIKAPGFLHLQSINTMTYKHFIADVVTIIGTQDIVFGEVDR